MPTTTMAPRHCASRVSSTNCRVKQDMDHQQQHLNINAQARAHGRSIDKKQSPVPFDAFNVLSS